jgi:rhomboid family protein
MSPGRAWAALAEPVSAFLLEQDDFLTKRNSRLGRSVSLNSPVANRNHRHYFAAQMIADRPYMRDRPGRPNLQVSVVLMIVLVAAFALQCINDVYVRSLVDEWLALTPFALARGYVWQFFTFQFLHVDILHLLGNLLGLWFFGRLVESVLGKGRFLLAYFGAGVIGGLLQCVLMLLFPAHFAPFVFGASAGVMGIFAIFARLQTGSEIRLYFVLPIRADVLLWITAAISLFFTVVPSNRGGGVAHAAHLGGILAGLAFMRLGWHQDFRPLPGAGLVEWLRSRPRRSRPIVKVRFPKSAESNRPRPLRAEDLPPGEFISREIDPILDKIAAHGIHSLTERERKLLEAARARMEKR